MNLFEQDNDQVHIDENKNYLAELVGEGKKFKSAEDLAKGKAYSDQYIPILERRLDQLTADYKALSEEYNAGPKLKELIDRLKTPQNNSGNENTPQVIEPPVPALAPEKVEEIVTRKLTELERGRQEESNYNQVKSKLIERFGNNFQPAFKEQVESLGLSLDFANDLARKSPHAFLKTFGLEQPVRQDNFQAPPRSGLRNDSFAPAVEKRTWAYYQKMRREQPELYRDPQTAVQMQQDAIRLGKEFQDGDWDHI